MKKEYRVITMEPNNIDSRMVVGYGNLQECKELKKQIEIASRGKKNVFIERNY